MTEAAFNPIIKAVQSLRKLTVEITENNAEILKYRDSSLDNMEKLGKMISLTNDSLIINQWIRTKNEGLENNENLIRILKEIEQKIRAKTTAGLSELWDTHTKYRDANLESLKKMQAIGESIFTGEKLAEWEKIWDVILKNLNSILSIAETFSLKFKMMEALQPQEVDEITKDIIKHIPWNYTDEEAQEYEKEYLEAYNELKKEESKNKNLWDKLMDILSGGIQETPAHMVQMKRWLDGTRDY